MVQDATIRHAAYDDAGMGNEQYMGVEFVDGPEDPDFNVALGCTLRFMHHARVAYSTATADATFTVREGRRVVAYGTLNSVDY